MNKVEQSELSIVEINEDIEGKSDELQRMKVWLYVAHNELEKEKMKYKLRIQGLKKRNRAMVDNYKSGENVMIISGDNQRSTGELTIQQEAVTTATPHKNDSGRRGINPAVGLFKTTIGDHSPIGVVNHDQTEMKETMDLYHNTDNYKS